MDGSLDECLLRKQFTGHNYPEWEWELSPTNPDVSEQQAWAAAEAQCQLRTAGGLRRLTAPAEAQPAGWAPPCRACLCAAAASDVQALQQTASKSAQQNTHRGTVSARHASRAEREEALKERGCGRLRSPWQDEVCHLGDSPTSPEHGQWQEWAMSDGGSLEPEAPRAPRREEASPLPPLPPQVRHSSTGQLPCRAQHDAVWCAPCTAGSARHLAAAPAGGSLGRWP